MADDLDDFATPAATDDSGQISEDDWAAAMAEQASVDSAASQAQPANIFPSFNNPGAGAGMMNELDMILDIQIGRASCRERVASPV